MARTPQTHRHHEVGQLQPAVTLALRAAQRSHGPSLRELAALVNLSRSRLGEILNDDKAMTLHEYDLLCAALEIDGLELLDAAWKARAVVEPAPDWLDAAAWEGSPDPDPDV